LGEERAARYFDIRSMLDAGITVAWGSDWPAGTPDANPFRGLEGLVTRGHPSGDDEGTWGVPITLEEGIRILTMGSAYAMERGVSIGSIEVDKHADFIVLDRDLFEIPPRVTFRIPSDPAVLTWVVTAFIPQDVGPLLGSRRPDFDPSRRFRGPPLAT
jgi:predicted amidohydrolase YtcJ